MALYKHIKTGRRHRTVDGSRHDRRLADSDQFERIGGGDAERSRAAARKRTGSKPAEGDDS